MTITVEDGTGLANANAYVSISDVTAYATSVNDTTWTGLGTPAQEAAIVQATMYLDTQNTFLGTRTSQTQALSWPRSGVVDTSEGTTIAANSVPLAVRRACSALALKASSGTVLLEDLAHGGAVKSETVGPISVTYKDSAPATTLFMVTGLLKGLTRSLDPSYAPQIAAPSYAADQYFGPDQFNNAGTGLLSTGG